MLCFFMWAHHGFARPGMRTYSALCTLGSCGPCTATKVMELRKGDKNEKEMGQTLRPNPLDCFSNQTLDAQIGFYTTCQLHWRQSVSHPDPLNNFSFLSSGHLPGPHTHRCKALVTTACHLIPSHISGLSLPWGVYQAMHGPHCTCHGRS